jgi:hypothetical protein
LTQGLTGCILVVITCHLVCHVITCALDALRQNCTGWVVCFIWCDVPLPAMTHTLQPVGFCCSVEPAAGP